MFERKRLRKRRQYPIEYCRAFRNRLQPKRLRFRAAGKCNIRV